MSTFSPPSTIPAGRLCAEHNFFGVFFCQTVDDACAFTLPRFSDRAADDDGLLFFPVPEGTEAAEVKPSPVALFRTSRRCR